ncbi:MAG: DUF1385 domain-containing protein [Thermoleophilia bacterium]
MALANGLLVHGPKCWAAAVRDPDGQVRVASGSKPRLAIGPLGSVPLLRGVLRLGEAMAVLPAVRRGMPQVRFAMEERGTPLTVLAALAVGGVARRRLRSPLAQEAVGVVVGLAPAVFSLVGSKAAVWHAVEHKSIAAYEKGGPAEVGNAAAHPKEHPRCGSNLVLPLMVSSAATNLTARHLLGRVGPLGQAVMSAVGAGLAVEMFAFAHRNPEHPVARVVHGAGHALQAHLATREPGPKDLEVGHAAMRALFAAEGIPEGA